LMLGRPGQALVGYLLLSVVHSHQGKIRKSKARLDHSAWCCGPLSPSLDFPVALERFDVAVQLQAACQVGALRIPSSRERQFSPGGDDKSCRKH
jgi:hypothetical protein